MTDPQPFQFPLDRSRAAHPAGYERRALQLVQDAIDEVLEPEHCPRCRSHHFKDTSTVGPRGQLIRWKWCKDCLETWDYTLEGEEA